MKSLLPGYQAGEIEALEDVESTDEGRACVWGSGTENQVAWKDRKWPMAGEGSRHFHIPPSHRLETTALNLLIRYGNYIERQRGAPKFTWWVKGRARIFVFCFLFLKRKLRLRKTVICPEPHCHPLTEQGQVFRCPDFLSTICLLSAPPSGPLLVPFLKLLGNSKFLFQFEVSVIRCLDIKGIIIPDKKH